MIESVVSDLSGRHRRSKVESQSRKARNRHPNRERLTNRQWDHVNFRMFVRLAFPFIATTMSELTSALNQME